MELPDGFRIVSGGQTGADRAALDFALRSGIPHGGWCPLGRLAEDGPLPPIYDLQETTSKRYDQRTRWNVRDSDATLVLTLVTEPRGGSGLTIKVAKLLSKPCLHISRDACASLLVASQRLQEFIREEKIVCLNIAGPRASQQPEIEPFVDAVLTATFLTAAHVPTDRARPQQ